MREVHIDLRSPVDVHIGYVGEHKATKLIVSLTSELLAAASYKIEFSSCGKVLFSNEVAASDETIVYIIPQSVTSVPVRRATIGIQVIGYSEDSIIKSPIVTAHIEESLPNTEIEATQDIVDITSKLDAAIASVHNHSNKSIIDKFSEDTDGNVLYNGKEIGSNADGKTPVKGTDYWTADDKAEIVADVLAALPDGDEVSY